VKLLLRVSLGIAGVALLTMHAAPPGLAAPRATEALGPARCAGCHPDEVAWWTTADGPPPRGHVNALLLLESAEGRRYARRTGVTDVYATKASCVACHATVFKGAAQEGVSCESCHGEGSGYVQVHTQPGAYRLAVAAGMTDVRGHSKTWAARCLECHIVKDTGLVAAGHSSGQPFDLGHKFLPVAGHWKRHYSPEDVRAAARGLSSPPAPAGR